MHICCWLSLRASKEKHQLFPPGFGGRWCAVVAHWQRCAVVAHWQRLATAHGGGAISEGHPKKPQGLPSSNQIWPARKSINWHGKMGKSVAIWEFHCHVMGYV